MRRFGLIGFPLTHSFSPAYFQDKFQKEGLTDYRYEAFPLASIELLPELLAQHPDLCGFNVTIPYKEQIIPYLDEVDEAARQIGAVNCVIIQRNSDSSAKKYQLKGYNTDAPAFEHCLKEGWQLPDKALVFGTGGAAKAVAYTLHRLHIDFYFVSRNKVNEQTIIYRDLEHPSKIHNIHDNNLLDNKFLLKDYKLWINTTPVGMYPHTEESLPLDFSVIGSEHYLFDLIYNPEETVFLRQGRLHGARTKNGLAMLHEQAELSWELFREKY
jgi:shikimate dehydrogenase